MSSKLHMLPKLAFGLLAIHIINIILFACIRYPLMNDTHYEMTTQETQSSRWYLALYQSVMIETQIAYSDLLPLTWQARLITMIQGFFSFCLTTGVLMFAFSRG